MLSCGFFNGPFLPICASFIRHKDLALGCTVTLAPICVDICSQSFSNVITRTGESVQHFFSLGWGGGKQRSQSCEELARFFAF